VVIPTHNIIGPYRAYADKPNADNWGKEKPDFVCTIVLQHKQAYKYGASRRKFYICTKLKLQSETHKHGILDGFEAF
jgi:hypothetical protein